MTEPKRRRKGKVHRAPYRARFEELLRDDCYTLDEMTAIIRAEFPDAEVSRSGLHRYDASIRDFTEKMHELETSAKVIAERYGSTAGDDTSTMLANAMVLLTTDTVLKLNANPEVKLGDVKTAAQITKNALESKRVSLDVRKKIEAAAREKLLQEQSAKLDKLVKSKGLSEETAADMRKKILGIS
jgi:Protein of unknown function (DUF3486).